MKEQARAAATIMNCVHIHHFKRSVVIYRQTEQQVLQKWQVYKVHWNISWRYQPDLLWSWWFSNCNISGTSQRCVRILYYCYLFSSIHWIQQNTRFTTSLFASTQSLTIIQSPSMISYIYFWKFSKSLVIKVLAKEVKRTYSMLEFTACYVGVLNWLSCCYDSAFAGTTKYAREIA